jgi:hypothetical protein
LVSAAAQPSAQQRYRIKITIYDLAVHTSSVLYQDDVVIEAPNWSRAGKSLLVNTGGNLYRLPVNGAGQPKLEKIDLGEAGSRANNDHDFSRDGKPRAFSAPGPAWRQSQVYLAQADGSRSKAHDSGGAEVFPRLVSGRQVAGSRGPARCQVRTVSRSGQRRRRAATYFQGRSDDGPEYSPDGNLDLNSNRAGG